MCSWGVSGQGAPEAWASPQCCPVGARDSLGRTEDVVRWPLPCAGLWVVETCLGGLGTRPCMPHCP